ncbi:hypothetical protein NMG60_11017404 [Bertholletia excelsa]
MGVDKKMFSFAEVSLHNNPNDCWVIINAKAYDVTAFLTDHPGGEEVLLVAAGKDASEEFEAAGHGSAARLMLDEFYTGEIDPLTTVTPEKAAYKLKSQPLTKMEKPSDPVSKLPLRLVVSIAILALAVGIYSVYE